MNQKGVTAGIIRIESSNLRYDLAGPSVGEMLAPVAGERGDSSSRMGDRTDSLVSADVRALKRELGEEYRLLVSQLPA